MSQDFACDEVCGVGSCVNCGPFDCDVDCGWIETPRLDGGVDCLGGPVVD